MDVWIKNGDIALSAVGSYLYLGGMDELIQRVRIAAVTKKGDFTYDRGLGIDLSGLSSSSDRLKDRLDMLLKEATADIGGVEVEVADFDERTLRATLRVKCRNMTGTTEVNYAGIL